MKFVLAYLLILTSVWAQEDEQIYLNFKHHILLGKISNIPFTPYEKLYVDALEDLLVEYPEYRPKFLSQIQTMGLSFIERMRVEFLKASFQNSHVMDETLVAEIISNLRKFRIEKRFILLLATYENLLEKQNLFHVLKLAKKHRAFHDVRKYSELPSVPKTIITELYNHEPLRRADGVKIFMFCRQDRLYPCLMVLKDHRNQEVRNTDGSLWSHQALASAVTGLPSHVRNGHTPAGVHTIDSVMPTADQQDSFGKFRRLILNFVPTSPNESVLKSYLPESSWDEVWWRPSTVARDIGRGLLRIHGSGKINTDPSTPHFPFNRTHGCISQRENTYNNVTYTDQRILLDALMESLGLEAVYENETEITGILYLLEIDNVQKAVELADLKKFDIQ
jgi:hypothetical protein